MLEHLLRLKKVAPKKILIRHTVESATTHRLLLRLHCIRDSSVVQARPAALGDESKTLPRPPSVAFSKINKSSSKASCGRLKKQHSCLHYSTTVVYSISLALLNQNTRTYRESHTHNPHKCKLLHDHNV